MGSSQNNPHWRRNSDWKDLPEPGCRFEENTEWCSESIFLFKSCLKEVFESAFFFLSVAFNFIPENWIDFRESEKHLRNHGDWETFNISYCKDILSIIVFIEDLKVIGSFFIDPVGFEFLSYFRTDPVPLFSVFFVPWPPFKGFPIPSVDQF